MKQEQIKNHIHNPYRFFEIKKRNQCLLSFLKEQDLPLHWKERELKLAWAFRGILGNPLSLFDKKAEYAVYESKPYITQSHNLSLIESLKEYDDLFEYSKLFNETINNHFAIVLIESKYCTLSKKEKDLILSVGKTYKLKLTSTNIAIINLQKATELVGDAKASNFRILTRIEDDTSLFSALCTAFEIPDLEEYYYQRDTLRHIFHNDGKLVSEANKSLDSWVEDSALKTHLSCFLEQRRGSKQRDIFLSSHYHKKWSDKLYWGNKFPGLYLEALKAMKATCLLGWEWEYGDLPESRVLISIETN